MTEPEFDRHARAYRDLHRANIASSGEEPRYFAEYKMRDFRALADELGLPLLHRKFGSDRVPFSWDVNQELQN